MKRLTIEKYRKAVAAGTLKDPLIFLDGIMNGSDLTEVSEIYEFVGDICAFNEEGMPTDAEWKKVVTLIRERMRYDVVKVSDRLRAAERLAEYIHPKLKTEESGASKVQKEGGGEFTPITEEEIVMLREKFNESY